MDHISTFLSNLYDTKNLPSPKIRREALVREMEVLEGKTIHCFTCPGTCCTSQANSMQITPLEALEILQSLKIENENIDAFIERMKQTVSAYRLNVEVYTGKKHSSTLRKNYTCPFFNNGSLGCGLSRFAKPYGCLGFNPKTSDDNGSSCSSNVGLLEERENNYSPLENLANAEIKAAFKISWNKESIPQALIDILEKSKT